METSKLYLKNARLGYADSLFVPKAPANSTNPPKYNAPFILGADTLGFLGNANPDSAVGQSRGLKWVPYKDAVSAAMLSAATGKWGPKGQDMMLQLKASNRICLYDGDGKADKPGYKGNYFINASSKTKIPVTASDGRELAISDGIIYSGCYVYAVLTIWAQDNPNPEIGKRINAGLLAVTFLRDGEKLDNRVSAAADDYAAIPQTAGPAGAAPKSATDLFA